MDEQLVGTVAYGEWKADVYSTSMPGEFKLIYLDPKGKQLEEAQLSGVSSYRQRSDEIQEHLRALSGGVPPAEQPDLGDSGEY